MTQGLLESSAAGTSAATLAAVLLTAVISASCAAGGGPAAAPPGRDSPTPTPGPCTAPLWEPLAIYTAGDRVTHAGEEWEARWWTQGEEPGTTGEWGVWLGLGPCSGMPTPTPVPPTYPPPGWPERIFAPYVDVTLYPPLSLESVRQAAGVRHFTLAFIVSGGGCAPAWGGVIPLEDDHYWDEVNLLRGQGGDVVVSMGGANGVELAQACSDPASLAAAYAAVIDRYDLTRIDLDIEGAALAEPVSIDRRNRAVALLQAERPGLEVAYCLPVLPTGLTAGGLGVLENALARGVEIGWVNIMAMDYGEWAAPEPEGMMAEYAIQAAEATLAQLQALFPGRPEQEIRAMLGITPMIGLNDVPGELFELEDAGQLLDYALAQEIGLLAMWSAGRDRECPGGAEIVSPTCSGILQADYAFSQIFAAFEPAAPPATATPAPTPTPAGPAVPAAGRLPLLALLAGLGLILGRRDGRVSRETRRAPAAPRPAA